MYQFKPKYTTDGGTIGETGRYTATIPVEFTVTVSAERSDMSGEAKLTIEDKS